MTSSSQELIASTAHGGTLAAHLARPSTPRGHGMLLLPMITGIGERVRAFAAGLARTGLTTLCWDPFHGASSDTHTITHLRHLRDELDDRAAIDEQRQLLDHLHGTLGLDKVGVIGYCLGGRFALLLAAEDRRLAGVVAYHPTVPLEPASNHTLDPFTAAADIRAPVLVHYPGKDHLVPPESLATLERSLRSRNGAASIVSYHPNAEHGFSDSAHHGNHENVAAYELTHPLTLSFLRSTVANGTDDATQYARGCEY